MFNFFKRKGGKAEPGTPEAGRKLPSDGRPMSVESRAPRNDNDVTNERTGTLRKDVINLLIPETDYAQKNTGVSALFSIMGKRKRNRRKGKQQKETARVEESDERAPPTPAPAENIQAAEPPSDPADCIKALVLQKYAKPEPKQQHVSLVYVGDDPPRDEKKHAEALLREIARTIDCEIDRLHVNQMGADNSKRPERNEPIYESVRDEFKDEVERELQKIKLHDEMMEEPRKSNLKPPRSDNEGCSDDDRSDNGKKRVTFRKRIVFDDGEEQTDDGDDSSFESLTSEEAEYLDDGPDNDELLGGFVVKDNTTIIDVGEPIVKVECVDDLRRITSDNSDSGFIECERNESGDETSDVKSMVECDSEDEEVEIEEIEEESGSEVTDEEEDNDDLKTLVSQESKFHSQVAALTELAETRCDEAERARDLIAACRKDIEAKDQEIEQIKCELAAAYKESELVRQRARALEDELNAAKNCSADLADELQRRNDETIRELRAELEDSNTHRAELESRTEALIKEKQQLLQEKLVQEQKAKEALEAAEANTNKWRAAHEAARSQASARAERMLADCEWKMRELEKRARDAEKHNRELTESVEKLKDAPANPSHVAELQQLRGLATEQQRSVQSLTLQLQQIETREETLKLEVHRLKDLLEREAQLRKSKEEQHLQALQRLENQHDAKVAALRAEHTEALASAASARAAMERAQAERTRTALAQLRAEHERDSKNAERKLRELSTRFENLKEVLASKESQFEKSIAEANSKADWDILQLRHLLDKADINYANNIEALTERYEKEKERITEEWAEKFRVLEEETKNAAEEARKLLEVTKRNLIAEKNDQISKLKEKHRIEMEEQWEQFMADKEHCLERMKTECQQEGQEERSKREKDLLVEIEELKSQLKLGGSDLDRLKMETAAVGRTLAVTEQELREALERERKLREKAGEDAEKMRKLEKGLKEQIEHLQRKCACLRKLFDDMRTKLSARESAAEQEIRKRDREIALLRAEVARLTKLLVEQGCQNLGARTRADGCEQLVTDEMNASRRKDRR
ncbi:nuclear matrix constituent protein 1a isoform X2 [Aricia agestis]|uniref:nuclear matrix constituent protein 1a isoform X2 n=1 Tax=Aricia agestis TaxID=91739 RepID=UPI001C201ABF|nr:nuclear matrix constituent protein 1a isoform X2 [Aricia agestis]